MSSVVELRSVYGIEEEVAHGVTLMVQRRLLSELGIYSIFFILMLWVLGGSDLTSGDDSWFAQYSGTMSLGDFLLMRYQTWTSRLLIEGALVLSVTGEPWVWRALTAMFMTIVVAGTVRLVSPGGAGYAMLGCLLFGLVPFRPLYMSGWVSTSVNYIWVAGCGVLALFPLKRVVAGGVLRWWEYLVYIPVTVYAVNQEQMVVILLAAYLLAVVYLMRCGQRWTELLPFLMIAVGGLLFVATAPGNGMRLAAEISKWSPGFGDYSPLRKALLGGMSTVSYYLAGAHRNVVFVGLGSVLLMSLIVLGRGWRTIVIGAIPVAFAVGVGHIVRVVSENGAGNLLLQIVFNTRKGRAVGFGTPEFWFVCTIFLGVMGCFLYGLYRIFGPGRRLLCAYVILMLGVSSRIMMGFSPTLYASGARTTLFCTISMVMVALMVLTRVREERVSRRGWIGCCCVVGLVVTYNIAVGLSLIG